MTLLAQDGLTFPSGIEAHPARISIKKVAAATFLIRSAARPCTLDEPADLVERRAAPQINEEEHLLLVLEGSDCFLDPVSYTHLSIITSDGVTLAESLQQEDGTDVRSYPNGNLAAHVVGYVSQQYGTTAIESVMNDTLTGSKDCLLYTSRCV